MYLIEYLSKTQSVTIAVSKINDILDIVLTLDSSSRIHYWRVKGHSVGDFGWDPQTFTKYKENWSTDDIPDHSLYSLSM
jgi:hypothetical protein